MKVLNSLMLALLTGAMVSDNGETGSLGLSGISVTPHVMAESMRYRRPPEPAVGARVQLFLQNSAPEASAPLPLDATVPVRFGGRSPAELLASGDWAWHDTPSATPDESTSLPSGAMTVWTFNGTSAEFGPGGEPSLRVGLEDTPWIARPITIAAPRLWLSAVTFLAADGGMLPDSMVVHLANESDTAVEILRCRLWLPADPKAPRVLLPQPAFDVLEPFNGHATIPPGERGGFRVETGPLPRTYAAVEVTVRQGDAGTATLWAYLRVKPEAFDISGGWVNGRGNPITHECFLKALKRLHINTAHIANTPGYTDTALYDRFPLKYFNRLTPFDVYDTGAMLPRIHAVEFLGEPQYGGGTPVPPQDVWEALHPYAVTRLPTSVTHSEERIWRDYAGLSDFPHYDAYRVSAPSPDAWHKYERWGDQRIRWGAPLETIGDMCRSLRELNRPMPCAVWSQGPHAGWDSYGGRERTSPTPDEIRMQAYHALSTRITSLYWFNLSLQSLVKWRDTLDELGRIGREMRMLDELFLEGDAYGFEQLQNAGGGLDWDIASVCGPRAALLFALDLDYTPDPDERVFEFGLPRPATWRFNLPVYLDGVTDVFRVDSQGLRDAVWKREDGAIVIRATENRAVVYVATPDASLRDYLEDKRQRLLAREAALEFDPAHDDTDFEALRQLAESIAD